MSRSNATTERFLREAGIAEGMDVLELGCGPGEITEVLAKRVGAAGSVLALDRSEPGLAAAAERLAQAPYVRFRSADLESGAQVLVGEPLAAFDAIVGRRVLMYLSSPAQTLATLLPWLRPGGLVVFEEADTSLGPGRIEPMTAHDTACEWLDAMLEAEGVDRSMGFHLPETFTRAGLRVEKLWAEAVVEGQGEQFPLAELVGLLAPRLAAAGVADAPAVEALLPRLEAEAAPGRVYLSGMRFCAVGTQP